MNLQQNGQISVQLSELLWSLFKWCY